MIARTLLQSNRLLYKPPHFSLIRGFRRVSFLNRANFCKLPGKSKFSSELGLDQEMEETKQRAIRAENHNVKIHTFVLCVAAVIAGSFFLIVYMNEKNRIRWRIILKIILVIVRVNDSWKEVLGEITKYQEKFLVKKQVYKDKFMDIFLTYSSKRPTVYQENRELYEEILYLNLNNKNNEKNEYNNYKQYLIDYLRRAPTEGQKPDQRMKQIAKRVLQKGNSELMLLAHKISNKWNSGIKEQLKKIKFERVKELREKLRMKKKEVEVSKERDPSLNLGAQDLKYEIQEKWLEDIEAPS